MLSALSGSLGPLGGSAAFQIARALPFAVRTLGAALQARAAMTAAAEPAALHRSQPAAWFSIKSEEQLSTPERPHVSVGRRACGGQGAGKLAGVPGLGPGASNRGPTGHRRRGEGD